MSTETEPQTADAGKPHVTITLEEARALQDDAQLRELKRKILIWAGGWVTLLTAVFAIVSLFGVDALVKSVADDELDAIKRTVTQVAIDAAAGAKASAESATIAAAKATDATKRATEEANKLAALVKEIESQTKDVNSRLSRLREKIDDTNTRGIAKVNVDIASLQEQVNTIIDQVKKVGQLEELGKTLESKQIAVLENTALEKNSIAENSEYIVWIHASEEIGETTIDRLVDALREKGFRVEQWGHIGDAQSLVTLFDNQNIVGSIRSDRNTIVSFPEAAKQVAEIEGALDELVPAAQVDRYNQGWNNKFYKSSYEGGIEDKKSILVAMLSD